MVINARLVVVCSKLKNSLVFFLKKKEKDKAAMASLLSFCFAKERLRKQAIKNN